MKRRARIIKRLQKMQREREYEWSLDDDGYWVRGRRIK